MYNDTTICNNIQVALIESRLKALDVQYMLPFYKQDPESQTIQFKNLRDDVMINHINSKFLSNNPIDLQKL